MSKHTVTRSAPAAANYGDKIGQVVYESDAGEVTLLTDPTTNRPFGVIVDAENKVGGSVTVQNHGECYCAQLEAAVITNGTHLWVTGGANSKVKAAAAGDYALGYTINRQDADNTGTARDYGVFITLSPNKLD